MDQKSPTPVQPSRKSSKRKHKNKKQMQKRKSLSEPEVPATAVSNQFKQNPSADLAEDLLRLYLTAPDSRKSLEANVEDFVKKLSELDVNGQAAMLEMFEQMSIEKPELFNSNIPGIEPCLGAPETSLIAANVLNNVAKRSVLAFEGRGSNYLDLLDQADAEDWDECALCVIGTLSRIGSTTSREAERIISCLETYCKRKDIVALYQAMLVAFERVAHKFPSTVRRRQALIEDLSQNFLLKLQADQLLQSLAEREAFQVREKYRQPAAGTKKNGDNRSDVPQKSAACVIV